MRKIVVAIVVFMFAVGMLYADAGDDSLGIASVPGRKYEVVAVGLSLAATVAPITAGFLVESEEYDVRLWALIVPGITVGPSVGHFYANQWKRGLTTTGLRLGILGAGIIAFHLATADNGGILDRMEDAVLVGGATTIALAAHALYDIATAQESAKKYNESLTTSGKAYIVPRIDAKNKCYGVSFVYSF